MSLDRPSAILISKGYIYIKDSNKIVVFDLEKSFDAHREQLLKQIIEKINQARPTYLNEDGLQFIN